MSVLAKALPYASAESGRWHSLRLEITRTHREPAHPGEMLLEEFLTPLGMTQRELADAIHVPYQRINEIINGRRGITPGTALRLGKYFGMSPGFWLNLQLRWDLYQAQKKEKPILEAIRPYPSSEKGSGRIQPPG
jgi:addiction module HigA family antidote